MRLLIAAATEREVAPFLNFMSGHFTRISANNYCKSNLEVAVCITGVGAMLTAFSLSNAFDEFRPHFALQAGVAGAYDRRLDLGSLVLVKMERLDLGVEDNDAYHDVFDMNLADANASPFYKGRLVNPLNNFPLVLNFRKVSSLTVDIASGHQATIERRRLKYKCDIENMEGAAFHYICLQRKTPFVQIRALSNYVEPRDTSKWQLKEAIAQLNHWMIDNISLQS